MADKAAARVRFEREMRCAMAEYAVAERGESISFVNITAVEEMITRQMTVEFFSWSVEEFSPEVHCDDYAQMRQ